MIDAGLERLFARRARVDLAFLVSFQEHESEGGRTPLMKACRAGHFCTVQFLVVKGSNVNKTTTDNDHTPLSLACVGGHVRIVEFLLAHGADPHHKLKVCFCFFVMKWL